MTTTRQFTVNIWLSVIVGVMTFGGACKRTAGEGSPDAATKDATGDSKAAGAQIHDGPYTISERVLVSVPGPAIQFIVSPDSRHWAYVWDNLTTGRPSVTADGKLAGEYGGIHAVQYTAAGKLVYVAGPDPFGDELNSKPAARNDMTLVIDGKPGPGYTTVMAMDPQWVASSHPPSGTQQTLVFSDDGTRVACSAQRGNDWYVNIDGKEFGPYGVVVEICFSPDAKHAGWITADARGDHHAITIDGGAAVAVEGVPRYLRFSPDGMSWVYTLMSKSWLAQTYGGQPKIGTEKSTVVRSGANPATYPGISAAAQFTPDGKHLFSFSRWSAMVDENVLNSGSNGVVFDLAFNPDSQQLVCLASIVRIQRSELISFYCNSTAASSGSSSR